MRNQTLITMTVNRAKRGSPSQEIELEIERRAELIEEADLVDEEDLPDEPDDDEADRLRHEQEAAHDRVEARVRLDEQREPEPDDIERRDQSDDIENRHLEASPEQRIGHHPPIIGEADERVLAKAADREEAEAERQDHRPADKNQQADRVRRDKEIAGDPFARAVGKPRAVVDRGRRDAGALLRFRGAILHQRIGAPL